MEWNIEAATRARRYFDDGDSFAVMAERLSSDFGESITRASAKSAVYRFYPELKNQRKAESHRKKEAREAAFKCDVGNGARVANIAKAHGVSEALVRTRAPAADYRRFDMRHSFSRVVAKRAEALLAGPDRAWIEKHPVDPSLEGEITSAGKLFLELDDDECRYSIGKDAGGGYRFCGCKQGEIKGTRAAYCACHGAMAVRETPVGRMDMDASLRGPEALGLIDADEYLMDGTNDNIYCPAGQNDNHIADEAAA
jgi:hypothetical protein